MKNKFIGSFIVGATILGSSLSAFAAAGDFLVDRVDTDDRGFIVFCLL